MKKGTRRSSRKTYNVRELFRKLRDYDPRFELYKNKGKGSHAMLFHPDLDGHTASYPIPCHSEGDDIRSPRMIRDIIRRFNLPSDLL